MTAPSPHVMERCSPRVEEPLVRFRATEATVPLDASRQWLARPNRKLPRRIRDSLGADRLASRHLLPAPSTEPPSTRSTLAAVRGDQDLQLGETVISRVHVNISDTSHWHPRVQ